MFFCFFIGYDGKFYKCFRVDVVCVSDVLEYVREILKCGRFDCEKNDWNW